MQLGQNRDVNSSHVNNNTQMPSTSYGGGPAGKLDPHMPVHPAQRVYLRRPWKQTLEDVCLWREERIRAGDDRWPGTVTQDKRERMLGKWLANQRSYRKLMDANPQNRKGLKGMCPERVRMLDARLPGWMGSEPNAQVVIRAGENLHGKVDEDGSQTRFHGQGRQEAGAGYGGGRDGGHPENNELAHQERDGEEDDERNNRTNNRMNENKSIEEDGMEHVGLAGALVQPVWHLRATWGQSLERARLWRAEHRDRWPNNQDEHGDPEEARVYRWLIEQRRYKRNFEAGKEKLGGMCQDRLDLLNEVLGEGWATGNRCDVSSRARQVPKRKKKDAPVNKRSRIDTHGHGGGMMDEGSSGLNYMASLASHEMDAMRHAQQQQAFHQQVMQAGHLAGHCQGYAEAHRLQQGHAHGHGTGTGYGMGYGSGYGTGYGTGYAAAHGSGQPSGHGQAHQHGPYGYGGYDGRQYHNTQQHIQQLVHSRGMQHAQAYASHVHHPIQDGAKKATPPGQHPDKGGQADVSGFDTYDSV